MDIIKIAKERKILREEIKETDIQIKEYIDKHKDIICEYNRLVEKAYESEPSIGPEKSNFNCREYELNKSNLELFSSENKNILNYLMVLRRFMSNLERAYSNTLYKM